MRGEIMICGHCAKLKDCPKFSRMYSDFEDGFDINKCKEYEDEKKYKYKKIAEHDDLMHLLYDFFTGQVEDSFSDEEIVNVIKNAMCNL